MSSKTHRSHTSGANLGTAALSRYLAMTNQSQIVQVAPEHRLSRRNLLRASLAASGVLVAPRIVDAATAGNLSPFAVCQFERRRDTAWSNASGVQMLTQQATGGGGVSCGLGVFLNGTTYLHNEINVGFRSLVWADSATGNGVVVLSNYDELDASKRHDLG